MSVIAGFDSLLPKFTLKGPYGIELNFDASEIFPDDPGNGTPLIVRYKGGTATYNCACGEGEVDHRSKGMIRLRDDQLEWLNEQDAIIEAFYKKFGA